MLFIYYNKLSKFYFILLSVTAHQTILYWSISCAVLRLPPVTYLSDDILILAISMDISWW